MRLFSENFLTLLIFLICFTTVLFNSIDGNLEARAERVEQSAQETECWRVSTSQNNFSDQLISARGDNLLKTAELEVEQANRFQTQGNFELARQHLRAALEIRKHILGASDALTIETCDMLIKSFEISEAPHESTSNITFFEIVISFLLGGLKVVIAIVVVGVAMFVMSNPIMIILSHFGFLDKS